MSDATTARIGFYGFVAILTLNQINAGIAFVTGICGLVVVLPRAIRTIRETDWKQLFRR